MITRLMLIAEKTVEELLNEGLYIDAAIKGFTTTLGTPVFYGLFLLGIAGAFVIRTQSYIPLVAFTIITLTMFLKVIPASAFGIVMGIICLVGGAVLYQLFVREKRP